MAAVKDVALKFLFLHVFSVTPGLCQFLYFCPTDYILPSFLGNGDEFMSTMKLIMPLQNPNQTVLPHPILAWAQLLTDLGGVMV
jgi:hypothetical protein